MKQTKKILIAVLAALMLLGCAACRSSETETPTAAEDTAAESIIAESTPAESTETGIAVSAWTAEGSFIDDEGNYLLLYHMTVEGGYEKDGWSATVFRSDGDYFGGEMEEKDGSLVGEFVSIQDDGSVSEEAAATLTQEGDGVFLQMEDGTEYRFRPDETDYSEADSGDFLPYFQYNQIYGDSRWDPIDAAAYDYLAFDKEMDYDPAHAMIPYVQVVAVEDSDPADVLIYGDYWLFEMEKQEDTLVIVSGGHIPGVIHAERFGEGEAASYSAFGMDEALTDDETIELLGEYYDQYHAISSDDAVNNDGIAQVIADYVRANDLNVTKYYLGGEEPKELP